MKGLHPNLAPVALALNCALALAGGCSHNQTGIPNPFLAPDRVSPPSTRAIAPGTAQPYYPGDQLPVMQSAAPAAAAGANVAAAAVPSQSPSIPPTAAAEPKTIAFSNEPSVAVPTDDSSLRFELPKPPEPEPAPAAPIAGARSAPAPAVANANTTGGLPTAQTSPSVVPANYSSAPTYGQPFNQVSPAAALTDSAAASPWRSPQIGGTAPPPAYFPAAQQAASPLIPQPAVVPGYVVGPPTTPLPQNMEVSLQAVPSPPPVESTTPRIRIPGYPAPSVTITPATSSGISSDGFRPRSSMR